MTINVAVTGVGYSQIGRNTGRTEGQLAVEACRAAIADAGLKKDDIEGLTMFPFRSSPPVPFQGPPFEYIQRSLALSNLRLQHSVGFNEGQLGAVLAASYAVQAGQCRHVLCYRAHLRQRRRYLPASGTSELAWDEDAYTAPFGGTGGAARMAMWAARYMHKYGTTQEQLGAVSVLCRTHAATNPRAVWQEPITLDDYMNSRWVATPFKLLDCDYPIDGAVAIILSRDDDAQDTRKPVDILATGHATSSDISWSNWPDLAKNCSHYVAKDLWGKVDIGPNDVDVAELYDGFSWLTIAWLEDLGFVEKGDGGPFFEAGGGRIGSRLAVNTDGGQLGIGRLHGFGKLAEAVTQLRGEAGNNQQSDARIAVASTGGGPAGSAVLLAKRD